MKLYPVLLAGGSGTRLWPLSRKSFPKQFSRLIGDKTLFQMSAIRLSSSVELDFAPPITITNSDFRFIVEEQLHDVGVSSGNILIEPEVKNTAPAVLAATLFAHSIDPEATLLVAPTDHLIPETHTFHKAISVGLSQVQLGKMVTFGILPNRPETGFGYLELGDFNFESSPVFSVSRFVEKPPLDQAERMLEAGNFLWNAGIFLFKAKDMLAAFETFSPGCLKLTSSAITNAQKDLNFFRLDPGPWALIENMSIDYAIMEKVGNLVAVPYSSKWSDLGGWDAVWAELDKDSNGTATSVGAYSIDCSETLLRSENPNQTIVGVGLHEIIAVAMPDAVLVVQKNNAQKVKDAVELLKAKKVLQAEALPKEHRPWGWFESLALGERFQVKRICVKPGGALSLQSHRQRSEHWVVVAGEVKVTIDNDVCLLTEGQSVYVPLGSVHRLENLGKVYAILIEVQIGTYLGEDDITRYEDLYARE